MVWVISQYSLYRLIVPGLVQKEMKEKFSDFQINIIDQP